MKKPYYLEKLESEFERRKTTNHRYSLRKYAQDLGLQAPTLSHVLKGSRPLPLRSLKTVSNGLKLQGTAYRNFIRSMARGLAVYIQQDTKGFTSYHQLNDQLHREILEDWEHFAVLNYLNTTGPQDITSLALRFNLPVERIETVYKNLFRSGLIVEKNNKLVKTKISLRTSEDIKSETLQKAHLQELDLIKKKLQELNPLLRDISSITFAGNNEKLRKAKILIRNFRKKINLLMEDEKSNDVFLLAIQLVPLTKPQDIKFDD